MARTTEEKLLHAAKMRQWRKDNPEAVRAIEKRRRTKRMADPERAQKFRDYNNTKHREYYRDHPERAKARVRKSEILGRYGMTVEQYDEKVAAQNGLCAICGQMPTRRLDIDHDHACCDRYGSCGKCIRDLLCMSCNGALGMFGDSIERLEAAIKYLVKWRAA